MLTQKRTQHEKNKLSPNYADYTFVTFSVFSGGHIGGEDARENPW